ncbi:MAG: DUF1232 domain-containing protein [Chloroflexia bacterium]|nr:DUF1232 domain-containing protein [Chloroflexia bacterium]
MSETEQQQELAQQIEQAESFYTRLRQRVDYWLMEKRLPQSVRDYVLLVPDFFTLMIRLLRDPRIDRSLKLQIGAAVLYVISPLDLVPDFIPGAGLIDDLAAIAFTLLRLLDLMGQGGEDILREHWSGSEDVLEQLQKAAAGAENILGSRVFSLLRGRFGQRGAGGGGGA